MQTKSTSLRARLGRIALGTVSALLVTGGGLFVPWHASALKSHPQPAQSYAEAAQAIEALKLERAAEMNPKCLTRFLTHGQKVQKAIVLVHGYTNCPEEFVQFGTELFDLGYNVLIVPLPHHGLADRLNTEQGLLTADELAAYTDQVVDLAQGLGDHVTVLGLSCGGVVTAWAAQNRSDVDTAVVISPAFGFQAIPTSLSTPVMNTVILQRDTFEWWYPELGAQGGRDYTYPQYSKHALAQIMRLGFSVQGAASWQAPAAGRVIVVTNAHDDSVNNELTERVAQKWLAQGARLEQYEFPDALQLPHDLIDPNHEGGNPEVVYAKLLELLAQDNAAAP